jgi:small subunit ribosomal protein S5
MTKKKSKTLEGKKTREEKITEDEKKRKEKKALSDQKVERPLEEKTEEKLEEEEKKRVETKEEKKEEKPIAPVTEEFPLWTPRTELGKLVASGAITSIDEILNSGRKIFEPEIIDKLVPNIKSELLLVGGRKGKGGGIQRIPVRITTTMHRSGRRFTANAFAIVGDENGLIGIGKAAAVESRAAIEKAIDKAKLNIMRIKRGCGSWECGCGENHSIPYKTEGKSGSVRVVLMPAPKGLGLVADDASKKILRLAGIKDVWMKTYGNTRMRLNLITALFNALKNLYIYDR